MENSKIVGYALRGIEKPVKDLRYSLVEYPGNLLVVRVYENQIMGYNDAQRQDILEYLEKLKDMIQSLGFRAGLEGAAGDPPGTIITG